jgi:ornithine cyclodeaminase/alanine dehydrogenase-like protein (mu-crystallin family)
MDATWITARRTGAATAIAAKRLAQANARTVGILGCGVQGRSNLEALAAVFDLNTVYAYDVDERRKTSFVREMSAQLDLEVIPVAHPKEAVTGCEIIVTAGPILRVPHATIQPGWMDAGAFASLIDFDSYWHADALREVHKFCTDDIAQFERYREIGFFQDVPPVHADLGELVAGLKPGRESASERTVACNLGLALEDIATAKLIYQRALERNAGTWLVL